MTTGILQQEPLTSSYSFVGQSDEAAQLEYQVKWPTNQLYEPVQYMEPYRRILREMEELLLDCLEDNWDGYRARGASIESYECAQRFILSLPIQWLNPEVAVDPDGEFSFDWFGVRGALLTISVGPSGQLTYAGRFGAARAHGLELLSEGIPKEILSCLARLT
ncbi:hypothetical protein ACFL6M_06545 [Candidatus Eisenbacteria bacterium]|uniref:DUF3806 domain-containing protein n=1 Tax=Eiseniibacteriota bacterium TaxID=2212470 RepID=A0ABV6YLM4_UNCEI